MNDYQKIEKATAKQIFEALVIEQSKFDRHAEVIGDLEAILVREKSVHAWKRDIAASYLGGRSLSDKQRWVLAFELVGLVKTGLAASEMQKIYDAVLGVAA